MSNMNAFIQALRRVKAYARAVSFISLIAFGVAACAPVVRPVTVPPTQPGASPQVIPTQWASREAKVESVNVHVPAGDHVQVHATVRGSLTESCAKLGESQVQYAAGTFQITVYVLSRADIGCAAAETAFETMIPLDVSGLQPGSYTVMANGVSASFTLPEAGTTPSPVPSAAPTTAPTAGAIIVPTSAACTDSARFVADVTIPDNTVVAADTAFTKTWRLQNTGSCTWDNSYLVSYISGTTMSQQPGYWIVPSGGSVAPGQSVDVSVGMTSPAQAGAYQSSWGLKRENGPLMPVQGGANGNSFYVKIRVGSGGSGGITAASIMIDPEQGSGNACTAESTYFVHATVTADGATTASYEINSTAGQIAAGNFEDPATGGLTAVVYGSVSFEQAGTKNIHLRFVGPYPYPQDITVNLRVNGGTWHSASVSCQ